MSFKQLRKAIKDAGFTYNLMNLGGTWYITGGNSFLWKDSSLHIANTSEITAEALLERIKIERDILVEQGYDEDVLSCGVRKGV